MEDDNNTQQESGSLKKKKQLIHQATQSWQAVCNAYCCGIARQRMA